MRRAVLLGAVNVGGANPLPMAEWRAVMQGQGLNDVQTYIQSGNAVVNSPLGDGPLADLVGQGIAAHFGMNPRVFIRHAGDLQQVMDAGFAGADLSRVHAFFHNGDLPDPDPALLASLAAPGDEWHFLPQCLILHLPAGIGRSKLAARIAKILHKGHTARNLRSVAALLAMTSAK